MSDRALTDEQAYILRELARKTYLTVDEMGDVFRISPSTVVAYTKGVRRPAARCIGSQKRREQAKKYAHARRLLEIGYTIRIIARETNLSTSIITILKKEMKDATNPGSTSE